MSLYPFLTDNEFRNNGLDFEPFNDNGRGDISGELLDNGKFKTPTLRNVALTAPICNGRFQTLEVVRHYNSGGIESQPWIHHEACWDWLVWLLNKIKIR